eukprot:Amastigsp_a513517_11.p5 type:complete len:165 gc:universal Amastigsp_a513517_11:743-1237(+)
MREPSMSRKNPFSAPLAEPESSSSALRVVLTSAGWTLGSRSISKSMCDSARRPSTGSRIGPLNSVRLVTIWYPAATADASTSRESGRHESPAVEPEFGWNSQSPPPIITSMPCVICCSAMSHSCSRLRAWAEYAAGVACVIRDVTTSPVARPRRWAASRIVGHG